jgi:hypothetical protein
MDQCTCELRGVPSYSPRKKNILYWSCSRGKRIWSRQPDILILWKGSSAEGQTSRVKWRMGIGKTRQPDVAVQVAKVGVVEYPLASSPRCALPCCVRGQTAGSRHHAEFRRCLGHFCHSGRWQTDRAQPNAVSLSTKIQGPGLVGRTSIIVRWIWQTGWSSVLAASEHELVHVIREGVRHGSVRAGWSQARAVMGDWFCYGAL